MEFFHEPNIDWMGKKWYFIAFSGALLLAGMVSIAVHRGLVYGTDFRGGTEVYVKFSKAPNVDEIRTLLDRANLRGATIQSFGLESGHQVKIQLDLQASAGAALDSARQSVLAALGKAYGAGPADKSDFNNAGASAIADQLVTEDPLHLAGQGSEAAAKAYRDLSEALVSFRNAAPRSGLIGDLHELTGVSGVTPTVIAALDKGFYLSSYAVGKTTVVGPKVGADLRAKALYVTLAGLGAMLIYIWFRFELVYGVAAVIATFHDVLITLGIFSLLNSVGYPGTEITLSVIVALLTLVGYSMNDTIVVFDRIRENVRLSKRENFLGLVNRSINQTLSRTILTSGLTFLAVLSLFVFGGEVIHGFALTLVIGVIVGTYSSIAIASPVLVFWSQRSGGGAATPVKPKALEREAVGARRS